MSSTWKPGVAFGGLVLLFTSAVTLAQISPQSGGQGAPARQVTFTKDVAPILQKSCQGCHRPGQIAPMSLLTYEEARPWARDIQAKVESRQMPRWFADSDHGQFVNDLS